MGTTLTGTQINNTYDGLIKTTDNGPIGSTPKLLTDGLGNDAKIAVGTNSTVFTGTADFTGATVTGISGVTGAQGAQGAAGAQGAQGAQGDTGVAGPQGAQGAAAAGGGTPPMSLYDLPAVAGPIFSVAEGSRTWVATTGYGTQGMGAKNSDTGRVAVFAMGENWPINYIFIGVSTAQAGAIGRIAIYDLQIDANDNIVLGTKLRDVGTFSAATTGFKKLDISSSPFTMPTGKDYGAVGIVVAADTNGVALEGWSAGIWSGNGGGTNNDLTWYRAVQWNVTVTGQNLGTTMPSSLATATYSWDTQTPLWIGINA